MKKLALVLVMMLALAFAGSAFAQVPTPVKFGVKAGLSMASLGGDDLDEFDESRMGFAGGAFAVVSLMPGLTFQPELLYVQKGAKVEEGDNSATLKLDYLDVGLFVRKSFPSPGISPYVFGGPVVTLNSKAEYEEDIDGETDTEDISDEMKGMAFGLLGGVGVQLPNNLLVEARYQLGLSEVFDFDEGDADTKCNSIMLLAGMSF